MSLKRKILQGSASNIVRATLSALVALLLPPFLVHRMSPAEYSAWVLILQISAYVNLLDLGLQTAIGKFVAEYDAAANIEASSSILSSSFAILCVASLAGAAILAAVTWYLPQLFQQMPANLIGSTRIGLLAVGLSLAFALPFNSFLATFTGLQRYLFPTIVSAVGKLLSSAALVALLILHGNLVQLALVMAAFNVATAIAQFAGWKAYASDRVQFGLRYIDRAYGVRLAKYGGVLSIWTVSGLLISGLDIVIVGHFDYMNTGAYAIASSVTNFMVLIIGSLFGPLLPAVSSLQAVGSPEQVGGIAVKTTRYCALLLLLIGLPILFGAYPLLAAWVGKSYATSGAAFLEVLVLGNMVRQLSYPYAIVVVATGKQHLATIAAIAEASVNIGVSIWLVQRIGAVGVAIGTLAGSFVCLGLHLTVSMHLTRSTIRIWRPHFVKEGLLRPLFCATPSVLLFPLWRKSQMLPASPVCVAIWGVATLSVAWFVGLLPQERRNLVAGFFRLLNWQNARA
jgi:O-antigen/teichoic acid export membrane protein